MEVADVVTVLGNLLDNALDAVAKVEDKAIKLDALFNRARQTHEKPSEIR